MPTAMAECSIIGLFLKLKDIFNISFKNNVGEEVSETSSTMGVQNTAPNMDSSYYRQNQAKNRYLGFI